MSQAVNQALKARKRRALRAALWRDRYLYMLIIPVAAYYVLFKYVPLYGLQIAFKNFKMNLGIWGSEWVGLTYFSRLFKSSLFYRVLRNTLLLNLYNVIFGFPAPILLALMFNEVKNQAYKRIGQSIVYIPHFFSWVVLAGMVTAILSPSTGVINVVLKKVFGMQEGIYFLASTRWWRSVFIVVNIWKEIGWGTIIYLAAISGVDPQLYEAAIIDGAGKGKQVWYITLPSIRPTIVTLLVLRMGSMMDVGFEPVMMLYNEGVRDVADVISTYIYRQGIQGTQYSLTTAMGMFQSVIASVLLLSANYLSRKFADSGIW